MAKNKISTYFYLLQQIEFLLTATPNPGSMAFGVAVKALIGMPTFHRAPEFESWLCCLFKNSTNAHPADSHIANTEWVPQWLQVFEE